MRYYIISIRKKKDENIKKALKRELQGFFLIYFKHPFKYSDHRLRGFYHYDFHKYTSVI